LSCAAYALIEENSLAETGLRFAGDAARVYASCPPRGSREAGAPLKDPTIDENSRHGHSLAHWYINETKVAMTHFEKLRPANHGFRREIAALLQSYADKPGEETKRQLAKFLPPKVLRTLTTERARELAEKTREKEKRLNTASSASWWRRCAQ